MRSIRVSLKINGRRFYKTKVNGGKRETALPPENNFFPFGTTPVELFLLHLPSPIFLLLECSEV